LRKILVIRFSSIGDIVLTSPVIRCLGIRFPDLEIHYLTKKTFEPVLRANPHIQKIYTIDDSVSEVIHLLREERYDFIVDLHKSLRSFDVRRRLRRPARSFPKLNFRKWLLVRFKKINMPGIHIVDRYFKAVRTLGIINDNQGLDYFIPDEDNVNPVDIIGETEPYYTAFVIGAKHRTKTLPDVKIIDICTNLPGWIILLGGKEDARRGELIARMSGMHVYNCCGEYNINQSASLIKQASTVITHDTGLMHVAAAFKKKIISIWGSTVPEFGMYPYMPTSVSSSFIVQVRGLSCRPCSKIGFDNCPKKHFDCMEKINTQAVINAFKKK